MQILPTYRLNDPPAAALFVIILAAFLLFALRARRIPRPAFRPIAAFEALKNLLARAAEAGQPVHISVGTAGAGSASTVDTAAGLYTLEFLADRAAVSAIPPVVTVADPTALPLVQDQLRRAYQRQGYPEEFDPRMARFVAPSVNGRSIGYGAGVMDILEHERVMANVMVGAFGDEFMLMAEPGAQRGLVQAGGTANSQVLPFVYTSVSQPLIGEEIYTAGAYLGERPSHTGSLLAQDTVRALIVAGTILLVLLRTLGILR